MKNNFVNIRLIIKDFKPMITLANINSEGNQFKIAYYQEKYQKYSCLFTMNDSFYKIFFDLSGARDFQFLSFDKDFNFVALNIYKNNTHSNLIISMSCSYIILLPLPTKTSLFDKEIYSFEIVEKFDIDGSSHIFATDEEKVNIIAQDPYRFYISINVWILRGENRFDVLDEIFHRAVERSDYQFCNKIIEVKDELLLKPDYQDL